MSPSATNSSARTSRLVAAGSMIGFPLLIIAANRLDHLHGSSVERVRAMGDHSSSQGAASILLYVSSLLLIAAVFAIGRLTIAHAPKLSRAAMTLGVLGAGGHIVLATYGLLASFTGAGDPAAMAAYLDRVDDSAMIAPLAIGIFLYGPAMLLLAIALMRAGIVGWIAPAVVAVAVAVHLLPEGIVPQSLDLPNLLVAAVFAPLGVAIARTSDAAFARQHVTNLRGRVGSAGQEALVGS